MNEFERAGVCDLSTDNAHKKDVVGWAVVGGVVDEERMNVLISVAVFLLDFVRDDDGPAGEGGRTMTGGVGGYEWMLTVLSSLWCVNWTGRSMGGGESKLVCDLKDRDASTWYGDVNGRGVNGINTPGGKEGARMRMYHPRFGR